MKWLIVTCDKSEHIVPVQQYLFKKYAPDIKPEYIDMASLPVTNWGKYVAKRIPEGLEYCVFGLDDYLPTGPFDKSLFFEAQYILKTMGYDRFELGYGACRKKGMVARELGELFNYLEYGQDTPYSVSCQFSIWKTGALREALMSSTTPWDFEINRKAKAACFSWPVMRWIEESALSKKWEGINLNGLDDVVVEELVFKGLIKRNQIRV